MAETVNSIRINTRLKTDGIAKDRKEIERQLKELAKEAESSKSEKRSMNRTPRSRSLRPG